MGAHGLHFDVTYDVKWGVLLAAYAWAVIGSFDNAAFRQGYTIPLDKRLSADGRSLQERILLWMVSKPGMNGSAALAVGNCNQIADRVCRLQYHMEYSCLGKNRMWLSMTSLQQLAKTCTLPCLCQAKLQTSFRSKNSEKSWVLAVGNGKDARLNAVPTWISWLFRLGVQADSEH